MIYFIILGILFFATINYDFFKRKSGNKLTYLILCLMLIFLSAFRYRVGGDTLNYMVMHDLIPGLADFDLFKEVPGVRAEKGWQLLTGISKLFGKDFYWIQLLQAIIVNVSIFYFIKKNIKYKFIGILIYYIIFYFYFNFEILRESIAICIFINFGVPYLNKKKYIKYYLTVLMAFFFHNSAIFLIFLPLVFNYLNNKKSNYFISLTIIFLLGNVLSGIFNNFIISISILDFISKKTEHYLSYRFTIYGLIMSYFTYIFIPLFIAKYFKDKNEELRKYLLTYALIGSLISLFTIFFRFINYFTPFLILAYSIFIINVLNNRIDRFRFEHSVIIIVMILLFYNIKILSIVDESRRIRWYKWWYPYETIFDEKIDDDREYIWQQQFNQ